MGGAPHQTIECSGAQFSVDLAIYVSSVLLLKLADAQGLAPTIRYAARLTHEL